jgi:hypothetical protein
MDMPRRIVKITTPAGLVSQAQVGGRVCWSAKGRRIAGILQEQIMDLQLEMR